METVGSVRFRNDFELFVEWLRVSSKKSFIPYTTAYCLLLTVKKHAKTHIYYKIQTRMDMKKNNGQKQMPLVF